MHNTTDHHSFSWKQTQHLDCLDLMGIQLVYRFTLEQILALVSLSRHEKKK